MKISILDSKTLDYHNMIRDELIKCGTKGMKYSKKKNDEVIKNANKRFVNKYE